MMVRLIWFSLLFVHSCQYTFATDERSFTIDYPGKRFLKDGKPFRYISGSMHYSRVPACYWRDRLLRMKAAGLNAVQTYVTWNTHETNPGHYTFEGQSDLPQFLTLANDLDLHVILRVGPYICAEWEFGGFPAWLMKNGTDIKLRTMDSNYLKPVERWLSVLLPKMRPLLYSNGGPIIMVQVENEYGSYAACDHNYMAHLRDVFTHHLQGEVVLFTTDGAGDGYLKCGSVDGVFSTVDFGPGNATNGFVPMKKHNNNTGPLVNSEYYVGWLDHWGYPHAHTSTKTVITTLDDMLSMGANVNMYMFEGGTNFGFWSGATPDSPGYDPCPTSYDYDAPLTESGDITDKYLAIRSTIFKHTKVTPGPVPPDTKKYAYGTVETQFLSTIPAFLNVLTPDGPVKSKYPLAMEQLNQWYGFILYRHQLKESVTNGLLVANGVRDRAYILLQHNPHGSHYPAGVLSRLGALNMTISGAAGSYLDVLVENQGRLNYGNHINNNTKGLIENVTLNGEIIQDWFIYSLNFSNIPGRLYFQPEITKKTISRGDDPHYIVPSIFLGEFTVPPSMEPQDTFLRVDGWTKGQAYINGINIGRYWPVEGPQVTLYVPGCWLRPHPLKNSVMIVELEAAPNTKEKSIKEYIDPLTKHDSYQYQYTNYPVKFVAVPEINGTTPHHARHNVRWREH